VVRRTQLLLDAETRELLDEHWERRGGTLHAAATEVFHAGFAALAEQRAALPSFDDDDAACPNHDAGQICPDCTHGGALGGAR
jgi:hypothetical protein